MGGSRVKSVDLRCEISTFGKDFSQTLLFLFFVLSLLLIIVGRKWKKPTKHFLVTYISWFLLLHLWWCNFQLSFFENYDYL